MNEPFAARTVVQQFIDRLADGDYVVERTTATATHSGAYQGIAPTDRTVRWSETHIYRVAEGRIAENWPAVNFERIMRQVNVLFQVAGLLGAGSSCLPTVQGCGLSGHEQSRGYRPCPPWPPSPAARERGLGGEGLPRRRTLLMPCAGCAAD